jgi:hypothetical protein
VAIHHWRHLITVLDPQFAASAEVQLNVYGHQRTTGSKDVSRIGHGV